MAKTKEVYDPDRELAAAVLELERVEGDKKSKVAEFNGRIEMLKNKIHALADERYSGQGRLIDP